MSILEIAGLTWIILIVVNLVISFFGRNISTVSDDEYEKISQPIAANPIINRINVAIEIINYSDATIYYAYQSPNRKFLTQGNSEQEVLDNLTKKHKSAIIQVISKEYVGTTYS